LIAPPCSTNNPSSRLFTPLQSPSTALIKVFSFVTFITFVTFNPFGPITYRFFTHSFITFSPITYSFITCMQSI